MDKGCPYPGLRAFSEEETPLFFGREAVVDLLVDAIQKHPFVAIVGSSGIGKTSILRAGFIPALHNRVPQFRTIYLSPFQAGQPLRSLAFALRQHEPHLRIAAQQRFLEFVSAGAILEIVEFLRAEASDRQTILIVDQFEELYTLSPSAQETERFVDLLLEMVDASVVRLVVSVRSDFISHMLSSGRLATVLSGATYFLGGLEPHDLRRAIEEPARVMGVSLEAGLVERIIADAGYEAGNLPLVQFTLHSMYEASPDSMALTHQEYALVGGVPGVLSRRVESFWHRLDDRDRERAKRILLRLVTPEKTRRAVHNTEFDERERPILERMIEARLIVASADSFGKMASIELAHEAIIRAWARLNDWIEEEREFLRWRERLSSFAQAWEGSSRYQGYLLTGAYLEEALRWFQDVPNELSEFEKEFISQSLEHEELIKDRARAVKTTDEGDKPLIFISYAHEDESAAQELYNRLKDEGLRPWIDKESIQIGREWDRVIRETIHNADFIIVCLSQRSLGKRGYFQREIRLALDCYNLNVS